MEDRSLGARRHKCRICGQEGAFPSYLVREMMQGSGDEFEYFVCDRCECLQIAEIPQNLGKYYGDGYFSFDMKEEPDKEYAVPLKSTQKVLDVGCGGGKWLVDLAELGYGNLWGCDPFLERDRQYGDRVTIRKCSIHEMEGDHTYAYIHMGDSFEHMTDPLETLRSAKRLLMPGGTLEMTIPTYPNIAFDLFGPYWFQIDAPRHITLHSLRSIQSMARQVGLTIDEVKYDSTRAEILISYFYQRGILYKDITDELVDQHFTREEQEEIERQVAEGNEKGRGDHMAVFMVKGEA